MTKTDFEVTAEALRDLPVSTRVGIYRRLVAAYRSRPGEFDSEKFGVSLRLPKIFHIKNTDTIEEK